MRNETFKEIAFEFKNTYGVSLKEYTTNPKNSMTSDPHNYRILVSTNPKDQLVRVSISS